MEKNANEKYKRWEGSLAAVGIAAVALVVAVTLSYAMHFDPILGDL